MKIHDMFRSGIQRLRKANIPEPELEVSLLLAHLLKVDRTTLLLSGDKSLDSGQVEKFEKNISRRLHREPLAYIIGEKEFWSLPFEVSRDVLIPRPETELLVEKALNAIRNDSRFADDPQLEVLDLGTGSGVIAIVIALEFRRAAVTAVDLSSKALKVAAQNAKNHKVADRINFINSNWFRAVSPGRKYDLVLANPPYIARDIIDNPLEESAEALQPEVGIHEPRLALDGGERGLESIKEIAGGLTDVLQSGGWYFMEIGADQAEAVTGIYRETDQYENIEVFDDYAGLPRIFQAQRI